MGGDIGLDAVMQLNDETDMDGMTTRSKQQMQNLQTADDHHPNVLCGRFL